MSKEKVEFGDIKVGDTIEVKYTAEVETVDTGDNSLRLKVADGQYRWFFTEEHADSTLKRVTPKKKLIPDDATAVSYETAGGLIYFALKDEDGTWSDVDGDDYSSTKELALFIKSHGKPGTIRVYDQRPTA